MHWIQKKEGVMRRSRNMSIFAIVVTIMAALFVATPAQAYSPGTATAFRPRYNWTTGAWDYYCSYAHWRSGAKVTWHCDLHERWVDSAGYVVDVTRYPRSGSWTPGVTSHTTTTYSYPMQVGQQQFCTVAWALSVDGGTSNKYACN